MQGVFAKLLKAVFRMKFFSKIMLTYTVILIITISVLAYIVTQNITHELLITEKKLNQQILVKVSNYLDENYYLAKKIISSLYLDKVSFNNIHRYMTQTLNNSDYHHQLYRQDFDNIFHSQVTREKSIYGISVYKMLDSTIRVYTRNYTTHAYEEHFEYDKWDSRIDSSLFKTVLIPSRKEFYTNYPEEGKSMVYTFVSNLRETSLYNMLGTLALDFSTHDILGSYKEYADDLKGYIIIVTEDGGVIYDSSNKYYNMKYPYIHLLKDLPGNAVLEEKSVVNAYRSDIPGVIVAGIIPEKIYYNQIRRLNVIIFFISFSCILVAFILSYASMYIFSRRVKALVQAMKKVRQGDLTQKIPVSQSNDEIAEISRGFNEMCSDLKSYINKVYVSSLKQKHAELRALQSQINPHFLYNTLEAIRMKAETEGKSDVSNMIYLLATLLRNTVKEEAITDIRREIKYCELYLELFRIRYGNRLTIMFEVDPCILRYSIPAYILQPVIENYVIHGFDVLKSDNIIQIHGFIQRDDIYFEVSDNGKGITGEVLDKINSQLNSPDMDHAGNHHNIGLANVNERVRIIYGDDYGISITSKSRMGTKVILKIKAKTKEELKQHVQSIAGG